MFNAHLRASGLPPVRVAVNLLAHQCRQRSLVNWVQETLKECRLAPGALELELTENAIMHEPDRSAAMLQELAGLGMALAIDDFGTGYSSLAYLKRFPLHRLKVDREFVRDIGRDCDD